MFLFRSKLWIGFYFIGLRNQLLAENLGLVRKFSVKYCDRFALFNSEQDYQQEAALGLLKSIEKVDLEKGALSTWGYFGMRTRCRNYALLNQYTIRRLPYQPMSLNSTPKDCTEEFLEIIPDVSNQVDDDLQAFRSALSNLEGNTKKVLLLHIEGQTYDDIGETLGLSKSRVGTLYQKGLYKLKRELLAK